LVASTTAFNGATLDGTVLEVDELRVTIPTTNGLQEE
jgi:hypothetical protein